MASADTGALSPASVEPALSGSEMSGSAVLVVVGEPVNQVDRDAVLKKITDGFLSWDAAQTGCDINAELAEIANAAPTGVAGLNGEHTIHAESANLHVDILINPLIDTVADALRVLLLLPTKHKHVVYAGYNFERTGNWILQDGSLAFADLAALCNQPDVAAALQERATVGGGTMTLHSLAEGHWQESHVRASALGQRLRVSINPAPVVQETEGIVEFASYLSLFVRPFVAAEALQPSTILGSLNFERPTVYAFPGGRGDCALFGISGFNMLVDGGASRLPCFWPCVRHVNCLDVLVVSHVGENNVFGLKSFFEKKAAEPSARPAIGHVYLNAKPTSDSAAAAATGKELAVDLAREAGQLASHLQAAGCSTSLCHSSSSPSAGGKDASSVAPVNLYHKIGHGSLDMYVLNPSKEGAGKASAAVDAASSVAILLVWKPVNPGEKPTRILFPGSTPHAELLKAFDKLKHLDVVRAAERPKTAGVGATATAATSKAAAAVPVKKQPPSKLSTAPPPAASAKSSAPASSVATPAAATETAPATPAAAAVGAVTPLAPSIPAAPVAVDEEQLLPSVATHQQQQSQPRGSGTPSSRSITKSPSPSPPKSPVADDEAPAVLDDEASADPEAAVIADDEHDQELATAPEPAGEQDGYPDSAAAAAWQDDEDARPEALPEPLCTAGVPYFGDHEATPVEDATRKLPSPVTSTHFSETGSGAAVEQRELAEESECEPENKDDNCIGHVDHSFEDRAAYCYEATHESERENADAATDAHASGDATPAAADGETDENVYDDEQLAAAGDEEHVSSDAREVESEANAEEQRGDGELGTSVDDPVCCDEQLGEDSARGEPACEEPAAGDSRAQSEEPSADEGLNEEPAGDEPVSEEPAGDEPVSEEPAGDEHPSEEPAGDEHPSEEPAGDEHPSEEPACDKPVDIPEDVETAPCDAQSGDGPAAGSSADSAHDPSVHSADEDEAVRSAIEDDAYEEEPAAAENETPTEVDASASEQDANDAGDEAAALGGADDFLRGKEYEAADRTAAAEEAAAEGSERDEGSADSNSSTPMPCGTPVDRPADCGQMVYQTGDVSASQSADTVETEPRPVDEMPAAAAAVEEPEPADAEESRDGRERSATPDEGDQQHDDEQVDSDGSQDEPTNEVAYRGDSPSESRCYFSEDGSKQDSAVDGAGAVAELLDFSAPDVGGESGQQQTEASRSCSASDRSSVRMSYCDEDADEISMVAVSGSSAHIADVMSETGLAECDVDAKPAVRDSPSAGGSLEDVRPEDDNRSQQRWDSEASELDLLPGLAPPTVNMQLNIGAGCPSDGATHADMFDPLAEWGAPQHLPSPPSPTPPASDGAVATDAAPTASGDAAKPQSATAGTKNAKQQKPDAKSTPQKPAPAAKKQPPTKQVNGVDGGSKAAGDAPKDKTKVSAPAKPSSAAAASKARPGAGSNAKAGSPAAAADKAPASAKPKSAPPSARVPKSSSIAAPATARSAGEPDTSASGGSKGAASEGSAAGSKKPAKPSAAATTGRPSTAPQPSSARASKADKASAAEQSKGAAASEPPSKAADAGTAAAKKAKPAAGGASVPVAKSAAAATKPAASKPASAAPSKAAPSGAAAAAKGGHAAASAVTPFSVDLAYLPHHLGKGASAAADFFRHVQSRYYVLSGAHTATATDILDGLLAAKEQWDGAARCAAVTVIPIHDSDALLHWQALNRERAAALGVDIAPAASRGIIQLQDDEGAFHAYRQEF